ncbi:hypothetical protein [Paenibacillus sp. HB172176]|uniref:hypothetical protein n=1 Tax=Paenibacillus sp. HB172176 TaxID=2493690 RepID=UPI00143C86E1|nr:hypothetical protein [Paenibacillus sp. HB172176]
MTLNLGRYGSREIMDLQIFNYATKAPILTMDYATSAQTENSGEVTYARGGAGNPKRISWNGDKESKLTIETSIFTMQHLALLAGESIESGSNTIYKNEVVTVGTDKVLTLSHTPVGGAANIFVRKFVNGILGEVQEIDSVSTNEVTLDSLATAVEGEEVSVYYQWTAASAHKLSFTANGFPPYVFMVGDTVYADEVAGDVVSAQMTYYKAKLQPNFTITNSPTGDPSSLSLVFDVFPVKVNGVETLYDMVIYEDEE